MERPKALVIDASVVVKWFVPESDSDKALAIRDAHTKLDISLFAPDLIVYELGNALRYREGLSHEHLRTGIQSFFALDLTLVAPTPKSTSEAIAIAGKLGTAVYDAA